jgi:hypothetical protein
MAYPHQLLPEAHYQLLDFSQIRSQSYFLIRHTDSTNILDPENRVKAENVAFQTDHLRDYSINLLGVFQPVDVGWQFAKESAYLNAWTPGDSAVPLPIIGTDVSFVSSRGSFFLLIDTFHQIQFLIETPTGKQTATCQVLHTPIRGNFWHCSLRWFVDGEDVADWSDTRRKRVLKAARTFIIQNALLTEPSYQAVPPPAYK